MKTKKSNFFIALGLISALIQQSCKLENKIPLEKDYSNYLLAELADTAINPGEDFNKYSTGSWLKNNPIPADESMWGVFQVIPDEILTRLKGINEEAIDNKLKAGNAQKIADFWISGMDTLLIKKQGLDSLNNYFNRIDAMRNQNDVANVAGLMHSMGVPVLFGASVYQDEKMSNRYALHFNQGGLGLPDRDYYFDPDERTQLIRNEYKNHLNRIFLLMKAKPEDTAFISKEIVNIETSLAGASRKLADLRDPYKNYNKKSLRDFAKILTAFDLDVYLHAAGVPGIDSVIIGQPEFFTNLNKLLTEVSLDGWKHYFSWHLIHQYAEYLAADFENEDFAFYQKILSGTEEKKPRWKRILRQQEYYLGDALGQLYIGKYYSPAIKARHEKLVDDVIASYQERIRKLEWMSDGTKVKALHKLGNITKKVGYPDKWKDYTNYIVVPGAYVMNAVRGNQWYSAYMNAKLTKPVDKQEWEMTPQTYNAYYNPSNNEIVLPAAAFIVPGIPEDKVDDAVLYAYAGGSTIGHELTHAFDDQGSQFDATGNLQDWWTPVDKEKFKQRCNKIVTQFDNYIVLDSLRINGNATQGENIADLGGILVGLDAFKKTTQYREGKSSGGLTPLQRYFFGWSISWLGQLRDATLALRVKTDVHAPTFLRINGPVVNVDEWYDAFQIKDTDKMYVKPEERVRIW